MSNTIDPRIYFTGEQPLFGPNGIIAEETPRRMNVNGEMVLGLASDKEKEYFYEFVWRTNDGSFLPCHPDDAANACRVSVIQELQRRKYDISIRPDNEVRIRHNNSGWDYYPSKTLDEALIAAVFAIAGKEKP